MQLPVAGRFLRIGPYGAFDPPDIIRDSRTYPHPFAGSPDGAARRLLQSRGTRMRLVRFICLAILCGLALTAANPLVAAPKSSKHRKSATALKKKLHSVRAQIHQKRVEIRKVKHQEHTITNEIESVERRLTNTE